MVIFVFYRKGVSNVITILKIIINSRFHFEFFTLLCDLSRFRQLKSADDRRGHVEIGNLKSSKINMNINK